MSISATVENYLIGQRIPYELVSHPHTESSMDAAGAARVPAAKVAKPVILEDDQGYVMAVVPAHHHVQIRKINKLLNRHMGLATEQEISTLFSDCEEGAIPPFGSAYGLETIFDDCLSECTDLYLEAGDHQEFIHLKSEDYLKLMEQVPHASISY